MAKKRDLTKGVIWQQILLFAIPIFLSNLFQDLYNSADSLVVGNYINKQALAAVSGTSNISNIVVGFFTGLSAGSTVIYARYFGARDYDKLHDAIHTSILFGIFFGIFLSIAGIITSPILLKIVDCPSDVFDLALSYLRIYLAGCFFTSMYNMGAAVLRSVGDSKSPFIYLVISSVLNIILAFLFVAKFNWGVSGVGWATFIAQGLSVVMVYYNLLTTTDVYRLFPKDLKIYPELLVEILNLGLPAAIQTCLTSFSNVFVQKYVNSFGSNGMAGIGIAQKLDKFISLPGQSIGLAMTTYISQNLGAKEYERAHKSIGQAILMSTIGIVVIGTPLYLFPAFFVKFFNDDPLVVEVAVNMMKAIIPLYFFICLNNIMANVCRGYGKSRVIMVICLVGMVLMRQTFLFVTMKFSHSIYNVYYCYPFGWFISSMACSIYYYFWIYKKEKENLKTN